MQTAPEQDGAPAVAKPTPLFRIDPGWPFVIAGLLLLVAGVLIPAQRDLQELRNTLEIHRALEDQSIRQLAAYDRFLNDLEHGDEQLVGRLAASQLNLMPKDERSMLLVPTLNATVTQWIEDSEPAILPNPPAYPDTLLSRLATGPRRLWVLACGAFLVFVGLMLSPSAPSSRRGAARAATEPSPDPVPTAAIAALPAVAATSTLVVDDSDASGEEYETQSAEQAAVAVLEETAPSSRLDDAFSAIDAEAAVADEIEEVEEFEGVGEFEGLGDSEVLREPEGLQEPEAIEAVAAAESIADAALVEEVVEVSSIEEVPSIEEVAEVEYEVELDAEESDETDDAEDSDDADEEHEVDASEDDSFACVDGEAVEMPDAVLSADAEAVCMADMTRASEASAAIVELKPPVSGDLDAAVLPGAESVATIDGGSVVESVARAETEALPGEVEPEGEDEPSLPSANDRALDALSLFHGLSEDRWISTAGRG
jgi:hypothetical protein